MMNQRVALITGGSTGIGAACLSKFQAAGWKVSVLSLPGAELDKLAESGIVTTAGDVTSPRTREAAVEQTLKLYGRIDALINNAGVGLYGLPTEVPIDSFGRLLDVNVVAPLALAQLAIPTMRKQAAGVIVNIGSVAGFVSLPWAAAYCASKSALHALDDSMRRELRGSSVHVIKVCPGIVDTKFREHVLAGTAPEPVRNISRVVSPEQVAAAVLRAIERRSRTVYVPRIGALFALFGKSAPRLMDIYLAQFLGPRQLEKMPVDTPYTSEREK